MPPTVLWAWILFCGASTGCLAHVDGTWIVVHSEERKGEEGCRKADGISRCQMSCPTPSPEQSQTVICFYIRWHNTKCTKSPQTAFVMLHQTLFLENHLFFWCKKLSVSYPVLKLNVWVAALISTSIAQSAYCYLWTPAALQNKVFQLNICHSSTTS